MAVVSTRKGRSDRVPVNRMQDWATSLGTDYWLSFADVETIGAAGDDLITDFGWTQTTVTATAGDGLADLLSATDVGAPGHGLTTALNSLLLSPLGFGGPAHYNFFKAQMGYAPSRLCVEFMGAMTVHSANENLSGWGLCFATPLTATNDLAFIYTDATNFSIKNIGTGAGNVDAGAADDAAWHIFKIVCTQDGSTVVGAIEWFIDGTSQGVIDLNADKWPAAFAMSATTTNRPALAWAHIWYE